MLADRPKAKSLAEIMDEIEKEGLPRLSFKALKAVGAIDPYGNVVPLEKKAAPKDPVALSEAALKIMKRPVP